MIKICASDFKDGFIPLTKLVQFLPRNEGERGPYLKIKIGGVDKEAYLTRIGADKPGIPSVGFDGFECNNCEIQEITVLD